ncbi:Integral membrane protein SYS1-related [Trypanosoma melophagium]|uniref:Integral membrane protein SYS1-related n=1 Tax=Trypanosoma melophagium TaxID=715481 RepID=UPI00351AA8E0|nr:Integral membrane protein SYS1-related [Trypanosoma melophagium]
MPIPLGASLSDPYFVFVQILHSFSTFCLLLGGVRIVLGLISLMIFGVGGSVSGNSSPNNINNTAAASSLATSLGYCFHVPLRSLFAVRVADASDGSAPRFFLMHVITAFAMSWPLALTIQRRKFALDFTFTLYAIYFLLCCFVQRRVTGGGIAWWFSVLAGFGIMYSATTVVCKRRELADIFFPLSSASATNNNTTAAAAGAGANINNTGGSGGGGVSSTTGVVGVNMMDTTAVLTGVVDTISTDGDGRSFGNGCNSPSYAMEAVLMGPGSASKRRR